MRVEDAVLFPRCKKVLFSAVISNILDTLGYLHQVLPQRIAPLRPDMVCVGRAMTVQSAGYTGAPNKPYGKMLEAVDSLTENEVYICAGSCPDYAQWGGLLSNRAVRLGAAGAVLNGFSRDTNEILALSFPVFSSGRYARDQGVRGQVIDYRCPITFENGAVVRPGDFVFADLDGVVAIPQAVEAEVLERAFARCTDENRVRTAILEGMSAAEAYKMFGVM